MRRHGDDRRLDAAGDVILVGSFDAARDLGGGPLQPTGERGGFVAKLSPAGEHVWSVSFGSAGATGTTYAREVAVHPSGDLVVAGRFEGTAAFGSDRSRVRRRPRRVRGAAGRLRRLRPGEAPRRGLRRGRQGGRRGRRRERGGGGALRGQRRLRRRRALQRGGQDVFVAKYDGSGAHLWSHAWGDPSTQEAMDVAVDAAGGISVGGVFEGTVDFGGGPLVSAGSQDIFLLRLAP